MPIESDKDLEENLISEEDKKKKPMMSKCFALLTI